MTLFPDLTLRRREPELMDDPGLDPLLHSHALRGLAVVNRVSRSAEKLLAEIVLHSPSGPVRVLDVAVELTSLHFRREAAPDRVVSEAIFADGAGALVGVPGGGPWSVEATGSCVFPDSIDAMTWRIGDRGFEMGLSARVPELLGEHLRPWITRWLVADGLPLSAICTGAIHPGGPRIIDAAAAALELPRAATLVSREVLSEHGNMSSPTILFVLQRLRARGAELPLVAPGFGPGLTAEALRIGGAGIR